MPLLKASCRAEGTTHTINRLIEEPITARLSKRNDVDQETCDG